MSSFTDSEISRLLIHLNNLLQDDETLHTRLPLQSETLTVQLQDGVILCKLINILAPNFIPSKLIREDFLDPRKSRFHKLENQSLVINAARRLNCTLVNVAPSDLVEGKINLILGLVWQILKNGMLFKLGPNVSRSLSRSSSSTNSKSFNELQAENSLLRWVNSSVNSSPEVEEKIACSDLKKSLSDGYVYGRLISHFYPQILNWDEFNSIEDPEARIKRIIECGRQILGSKCLLEVEDVLSSNETMNTLFLATLCRHISDKMNFFGEKPLKSEGDDSSTSSEEYNVNEVEEYQNRIEELLAENEFLKKRVQELEADVTDQATSSSSIDEIPMSKLNIEPDHVTDDKPVRRALGEDAIRLKRIYYETFDLISLVKLIYNDISCPSISEGSTFSGYLFKKKISSSQWSKRWAVIKDNFFFFYKSPNGDEPTSVEKLDDCSLKSADGQCGKIKEPVLAIEISSRVNPHYCYISSNPETLDNFKTHIISASSWWNNLQ